MHKNNKKLESRILRTLSTMFHDASFDRFLTSKNCITLGISFTKCTLNAASTLAVIKYSFFRKEDEVQVADFFSKARVAIRCHLAKTLGLRRIPQIKIVKDEEIETMIKIGTIINEE